MPHVSSELTKVYMERLQRTTAKGGQSFAEWGISIVTANLKCIFGATKYECYSKRPITTCRVDNQIKKWIISRRILAVS